MDYKTFITEIVKATAWPIAGVGIVWLLRQPLAALIPLLQELEFKGLKAKFSRGLKEAEEVAELASVVKPLTTASPQLDSELQLAAEIMDKHLKLLEVSPEAAALEAWREFEQAVRQAALRLQLSVPSHSPIRNMIEKFWQDGWLTPEWKRLIVALTGLRNLAAHGGPDKAIGVADATRFLSLIGPLTRYFQSLTRDSPKPRSLE